MGLFEHFPFTNFHQLNLDWLIQEIKNLENHAVLSVNGETGDVVLYKSENIVFPDVESSTWRMVRTADGHTAGIMFQNGLAYVMFDSAAERIYTVDHPPAYPVTSVNGQTGDVTTYNQAYNRLPAVSELNTNFYRTVDKDGTPADVGIQVDKTKIERMNGSNRYKVYDEQNTPPYPVTSVNGQTGAVILAIPFDDVSDSVMMATEASADHTAGFGRETLDGTVSIYTVTTGTDASAYIHFVSSDDQYNYTRKLLTLDDIPSSSGVVSLNGLTGVVTLYGDTMPIESGSLISTKQYIINGKSELVYLVNGDTASDTVPVNAYVYIINNTHGLSDGYYKNTSAAAFPITGGTADSTIFTAVDSSGLINNVINNINSVVYIDAVTPLTTLDDVPLNTFGRIALDTNVSPTGTLAAFNYICYGMQDYQSILLSSTYSDREWMTAKHGTSWRTWKEIDSKEQNFRSVTFQYTVAAGGRVNTNLKTLIDADMPTGGVFAGIVGFQSGDANAVISAAFYNNNNYSLCVNNIGSVGITDKTATIYYKYV